MKFRLDFRRIIAISLQLFIAQCAIGAPCVQPRTRQEVWVTQNVDSLIRSARLAFDDEKNETRYHSIVDRIARTVSQCQLDADPTYLQRYPRFLNYIATLSQLRRSDHELGFEVPDKQYFADTQPYVQIPEFLLDQKFLQAASRFETLPKAKAYLEVLNTRRGPDEQLIFLSYESRHLGTPDNDDSFRRLLIVVPGNPARNIPEKWVQIGVTDPGVRVRTRNLSVVAATPNSNGGSNIYFKDFFRIYKRDGTITLNGRRELGYGDDNCVQCHKSGILPIFPEAGSLGPGEQKALAAVNERFQTYGKPGFQGYRDESKFGPGLSSASQEDRERRFGKTLPPRVVNSMNCVSCHNKQGLGTFNWPMDQVLLSSFIKGGQMPYGSSLKPAERTELYEALVEEYFATDENKPGILKAWLLGTAR